MEQPIALYLDLKAGEDPDLEVVARASISFVAAIREMAFVLDPSLEVRVGLESSTEGSLSLNSILKAVRGKPKKATLVALMIAAAIWMGKELSSYAIGKVLDRLLDAQDRAQLSDEEVDRIAAAVKRAMENKVAEKHIKQVFRELETDPTITGVAVTTTGNNPPAPDNIVPRSEFLARSSTEVVPDTAPRRRSKKTKERVTLIAPVLLDRTRKWKFYLPQIGEFGAKIEDEKFLRSLVSGRRKVSMRGGIQMDVVLETRESFVAGAWVVVERAIIQVDRVRSPTRGETKDLFAQLAKEKHGSDDED